MCRFVFFFQAEDGIRDLVRSRGLGDVYKRQHVNIDISDDGIKALADKIRGKGFVVGSVVAPVWFLSLIHI
mgnify:CR=1 FL=1